VIVFIGGKCAIFPLLKEVNHTLISTDPVWVFPIY